MNHICVDQALTQNQDFVVSRLRKAVLPCVSLNGVSKKDAISYLEAVFIDYELFKTNALITRPIMGSSERQLSFCRDSESGGVFLEMKNAPLLEVVLEISRQANLLFGVCWDGSLIFSANDGSLPDFHEVLFFDAYGRAADFGCCNNITPTMPPLIISKKLFQGHAISSGGKK